jgi:hypothetical protein
MEYKEGAMPRRRFKRNLFYVFNGAAILDFALDVFLGLCYAVGCLRVVAGKKLREGKKWKTKQGG